MKRLRNDRLVMHQLDLDFPAIGLVWRWWILDELRIPVWPICPKYLQQVLGGRICRIQPPQILCWATKFHYLTYPPPSNPSSKYAQSGLLLDSVCMAEYLRIVKNVPYRNGRLAKRLTCVLDLCRKEKQSILRTTSSKRKTNWDKVHRTTVVDLGSRLLIIIIAGFAYRYHYDRGLKELSKGGKTPLTTVPHDVWPAANKR